METATHDPATTNGEAPAPWENDPDPAPQEPDTQEEDGLVLGGTGQQLSFSVGGKKPTSSHFRLTGGEIQVEGQFSKGETVTFTVQASVDEVAFRDEKDAKTGQVVGAKRVHKARIVGVDQS